MLDASAGDAHMTGQVGPTSVCDTHLTHPGRLPHPADTQRHSTGEIAEALVGLRLIQGSGKSPRTDQQTPYPKLNDHIPNFRTKTGTGKNIGQLGGNRNRIGRSNFPTEFSVTIFNRYIPVFL